MKKKILEMLCVKRKSYCLGLNMLITEACKNLTVAEKLPGESSDAKRQLNP